MAKQRKRGNVEQPEPAPATEPDTTDQPETADANAPGEPDASVSTDDQGDPDVEPAAATPRRSPVWMVPTDDGWVPEGQVRRR